MLGHLYLFFADLSVRGQLLYLIAGRLMIASRKSKKPVSTITSTRQLITPNPSRIQLTGHIRTCVKGHCLPNINVIFQNKPIIAGDFKDI